MRHLIDDRQLGKADTRKLLFLLEEVSYRDV